MLPERKQAHLMLREAFGMAGLPQVQLLSYANNSKRIAVFACYF